MCFYIQPLTGSFLSRSVGADGVPSPKCISEDLHAHVISLIHFDPDAPITFKVSYF